MKFGKHYMSAPQLKLVKGQIAYKAVLAFFMVFYGLNSNCTAQIYASGYSSNAYVENAENAVENINDFAKVKSYGGAAFGAGSYSGNIELEFDEFPDGETKVPAGTTVYIKIGGFDDIFSALLGGALGEALANLLGSVIFGNHFLEIDVKDGANTVMTKSTLTSSIDDEFRVLQGKDGSYYLAVTPLSDFNRIKITDKTAALLFGSTNFSEIYYASYYEDDPCSYSPEFVSYGGEGINLDALSLGSGGVQNASNAIDDDLSTTSSISPGLLNALGSISQYFYFSDASDQSDEVLVTLSGDPSLINLELLSNVSFLAYEGDELVYEQDLGALSNELLGLIKLDLLGLLGDGEQVTFPVSPGHSFDRFEIKVSSLLDVDVGEALNIHEVERTIGMPSFEVSGNEFTVCQGDDVILFPDSHNGSVLKWYDEVGNLMGEGESLTLENVSVDQTYYVSSTDECGGESYESARAAINLIAMETPEESDFSIVPSQAEYGEGEIVVLEPFLEYDADLENPEFYWTLSPFGEDKIEDEQTVDKGDHIVTYKSMPEGKLQIEGLWASDDDPVYLFLYNEGTPCGAMHSSEAVFKVLPIAWGNFDASITNDGVELDWSIFMDKPLDEMIIHRSDQGLKWVDIGVVKSKLSKGESGNYKYVDFRPEQGANYYRIEAVYEDGKSEFSKTVRADFSGQPKLMFSISPNPIQNGARLMNLSGQRFSDLMIKIYDYNGILLSENKLGELLPYSSINLESAQKLRSGLYFYSIETEKETLRIKVIK
ncbi:T9SS type A sorting domain-containing protein [Echinicola sp. CAU 1574]|uniref:T9SS type A sorting domain-containing protein n=1 Tax=Echinicola arenosa TaxID=2774144 RepID=A0ABR9AGZ5_9BACT|nr:T9SS type A sorting domain-containing protein [Echinicola arenosa]MBD8487794.1 T9SS type A sorting domain-containing protein [Echinicola arenosa]